MNALRAITVVLYLVTCLLLVAVKALVPEFTLGFWP